MRLRMLGYVAIGALTTAGLVPVVSPTTDSARGALRPCAPSPAAGAVRLVVAPGSVAAGQAVHLRIDNSTGPTITYGAGYSIQRCVAGVWMLAPFNPPGSTKQLIRQRPGHGRWQSVQIPTTAATGKYRVRKSVGVGGSGRWLYGDFEVAPGI